MRLSEISEFRGISTYEINAVHRSTTFCFRTLFKMFRFYHFSDSLNSIIKSLHYFTMSRSFDYSVKVEVENNFYNFITMKLIKIYDNVYMEMMPIRM